MVESLDLLFYRVPNDRSLNFLSLFPLWFKEDGLEYFCPLNLFKKLLFLKENFKANNYIQLLRHIVKSCNIFMSFSFFQYKYLYDFIAVVLLIMLSTVCMVRCGATESSTHLFFYCNIFRSVWHLIYRWVGISAAVPYLVPDHFNQFSFSGGFTKTHRSIIQVI